MQGKKFISPGAWFSLIYPENWNEFEDMEGTFLFYNPEKWTGNFRVSAFKKDAGLPGSIRYARETVEEELKQNRSAAAVQVGNFQCAYYKETIQEEGNWYVTHIWITGRDNVVFECSFTVPKGGDYSEAEAIIATLEVRREGKSYPVEVIPIRALEILTVNEQYDWTAKTIKTHFKKDFNGTEEDIARIQAAIDQQVFKAGHRSSWQALGITFGVILTNEIEGMEWVTVVDGSREIPAIRYRGTGLMVYPLDLFWEKAKKGEPVDPAKEYQSVLKAVGELEKR